MADIIIDNNTPGLTSSTGTWRVSQAGDGFGGDSLYADQGQNTFRWTPAIAAEGDFDVYVRWSTWPARGSAIPIIVKSAAATPATKTFDERSGGGQWVLHGRYHFLAGVSGYIETNSFTGQAAADAVKLVPVAAPVPVPPAAGLSRIDFVSASGLVASLTLPPNVTITVS